MALRDWEAKVLAAPGAIGRVARLTQELEQILPSCPLCSSKDHMACRFQAGSLYCITHNCANPHHRSKA